MGDDGRTPAAMWTSSFIRNHTPSSDPVGHSVPGQTITILTMGSLGDVQPYVALGKGLAGENYVVRIATLEPFRNFVGSQGLRFVPIPDPFAAVQDTAIWRMWQSSNVALWDKLRALRGLLRQARPSLIQNFDASLEACRGSHAILSSFTGFSGPHVAARLGILHLWALVQPCTPTRHLPNFLSPWQNTESVLFNLGSHRVADAGFRWLFASAIHNWYADADVGIPGKRGPVIYGFSPVLIPRPKDWGADVHVTGDWCLDAASSWTPPEELARHLTAHENPVCLCHSAITGWRSPDAALDLMLESVRASGLSGIIVSRFAGNRIERLSDSCIMIDSAPFEWLFPRVRLIVHHGGAGTTAATLRAGRPSIVLPSCFDQLFWAHALRRLGAATPPLDPHRVTAKTLVEAIHEAISGACYAANAERHGEMVRKENGVRLAVDTLRRYLAKSE